jgi:hypothetical protein
VITAVLQVLLYALAAAASPLVAAATFLVIRSKRPRTNGIAFLVGFLVGTAVACVLGLVLGEAAADGLDAHETIKAALTLALGLALVAVGLRSRGSASPPTETGGSRARAILDGLANVGPAATLSMAALLGFGGPKRLVLTFLAMATVTNASLNDVAYGALVLVYFAIATLLVTVPMAIVIVAGERATEILTRGESWVTDHAVDLRVWLSLGFGAVLVVDGLVHLFV